MSKTTRFVPKEQVREYKEVMEKVIPKVRKKVVKEFGLSFGGKIVGSASRNLVVQRGNSHWDVDYQFVFSGENINEINGPNLKIFIGKSFQDVLKEKYSVRLSTSVITICLKSDEGKHAIKSFDVALIKNNEKTGNKEILRGKTFDKSSPNYIRWEELKSSKETYSNISKISGVDMWETFRSIYLEKKSKEMDKVKDEQLDAFSIYLKTIEETLAKHKVK